MSAEVTIAELMSMALAALGDAEDGQSLAALDEALIELGVAVSVTSLDRAAVQRAIANAYDAGATTQQIQEVVSLISGLGVHSLMVSSSEILAQAAQRGESTGDPLTSDQQALWQRHVGDDPFWTDFERELPGFLEAMLRLSADQFVAFFDYCAVPWKSGSIRARTKELIAMASDATPAHLFVPGFRLHLANAIKLGAGRAAITRALDIAAEAPAHIGTR
jgi:alkylhydroperoxidase/carboxymuconolactone decarboxylase family protein YurZ